MVLRPEVVGRVCKPSWSARGHRWREGTRKNLGGTDLVPSSEDLIPREPPRDSWWMEYGGLVTQGIWPRAETETGPEIGRQAGRQTHTQRGGRKRERETTERQREREREGEGGGRETINHRSPSSVLIGTWSFEGLGADSKERTTTNCISVFQRGVLKCGQGFH